MAGQAPRPDTGQRSRAFAANEVVVRLPAHAHARGQVEGRYAEWPAMWFMRPARAFADYSRRRSSRAPLVAFFAALGLASRRQFVGNSDRLTVAMIASLTA